MSNIITVRDGDIIAAEINVIKDNAKRVMISSAIEIGRRLVEAKSVVGHGDWMKWLEEKVDYSQSTANNLMKLYQEYGTGEVNLFDNWTNSEAFGKLSYTQHLALLALPFGERAEFAETHQVADMSTRELEKAIREELEETKKVLAQTEESLRGAEERAREAEAEISDHAQTADRAMKDRDRAVKSEQNALGLVEKLRKGFAEAQAAENRAKNELAMAKDDPKIPDTVMEQLRADAAAKATEEIQKELDAARAEATRAEQARADAERKAAEAIREAQLSSPDMVLFGNHLANAQEQFGKMLDALGRIKISDPKIGETLKRNVWEKLLANLSRQLEAV